jgi:phenol/toluene 2-monooxygenase (NADH) P3/A3
MYFEEQMMGGLFPDLEFYGLTPPRHVDIAIAEKDHYSHQTYFALYQWSHLTAFHTSAPPREHLDWLSSQYPGSFDQVHRPVWEKAIRLAAGGNRYYNPALAPQCQVCMIPPIFTEPGDPTKLSVLVSEYKGNKYVTCSEGCKWIFDREPEKYIQARTPTDRVLQGLAGGPTIPEVIDWFGMTEGVENREYLGSGDAKSWDEWQQTLTLVRGEK